MKKKTDTGAGEKPESLTGIELMRRNQRKKSIQKKNNEDVTRAASEKEKVRILFPTDSTPLGKVSFFVKMAAILVVIAVLVTTLIQFMEYSELEKEKAEKEARYAELQKKIDELNYYIDSPIDEYYVRKFAWEIFGMVPSDGDVVVVNP